MKEEKKGQVKKAFSYPKTIICPHTWTAGYSVKKATCAQSCPSYLRCGWASWDIDIDGNNTIASTNNRVRIVIISASIGTGAHGDHPPGLGHLIVHFTKGRCHLVGQSSSNDHDIGLTGRGTEDNSEAILIITSSSHVHHLDGTAGETEGHGPNGTLTTPVDDLVHS